MIQENPGIAVVGGGYWGKNLVRNFHALGALRAICDTDPLKREEYAASYPSVPVTADYEAILADGRIDGVVIATPAVTHYALAGMALAAGKDVLVEKPLALTVEEGRELAALAATRHRRVLMVGHVLEYHPAVEKLSALVKSGALGKIRYLYSNRLNLGKFRTEENILWSFAPHDISVIINLLGEVPGAVTASGGSYLTSDLADVTVSNLFFAGGIRAHIFVSWLHPYKEQKLVVVGSEKMAVFNDLEAEKLLLYHHRVNWVDRLPVAARGEAEAVPVDNEEPLRRECAHFLECVKTRGAARTGPSNALEVLAVLSASQKSLESGGEKIYLSSGEDDASPAAAPAGQASGSQPGDSDRFKAAGAGDSTGTYVHPSSFVDAGARLGRDTRIWHYCHVMAGAEIGDSCNLGQNVFVGGNVKIGPRVRIQNNVSVYEGVTLEEEVFCGPSVVFTNVNTPRAVYPRNAVGQYTPTLIRRGASIGANATIRCGVTVGAHALIGAGAMVTRDIPEHGIVVGNPARLTGWICRCGDQRISLGTAHLHCSRCGTDLSPEAPADS